MNCSNINDSCSFGEGKIQADKIQRLWGEVPREIIEHRMKKGRNSS
jgi:hypothetical protein